MSEQDTSFLERLIKSRSEKCKEREVAVSKRQAVLDVAKHAGHDPLTDDEDRDFRGFTEGIKLLDAEIARLDERITELDDENQRSSALKTGAAIAERATTKLESISEPALYTRAAAKTAQRSYIADLIRSQTPGQDPNGIAAERMRRHAQDVATNPEYAEYRAINGTDGTGGYAIPPAWLMDQYISLARAGRAFANLVTNEALPGGTNSINIPKLLTGTTTAIQATQNSAVSQTDLTDTSVQANVQTVAGQELLSLQLIDQSPIAFDEVVFRDLVAAHATNVDTQVISGSGSGGQVTGVNNTSGITTIALTGLTIQLVYAAIANAIQTVHTSRFLPPDVIVMHPRRWGWFLSLLDTTDRPLFLPAANSPWNAGGILEKVDSQQVVGQMHGLPVVTDPSIATTSGAGSNQDYIYVLRSSDLILFESGLRTRVLPETYGNQLSVLLQVYSYIAFTAARYPASVCTITGATPPTWGS